MIVGFTDAPYFRQKGAVAYGFGLFSRTLTAEAMAAASTVTTSGSTWSRSPSRTQAWIEARERLLA